MNVKDFKVLAGIALLTGVVVLNAFHPDQFAQGIGLMVAGYLFGASGNGKPAP